MTRRSRSGPHARGAGPGLVGAILLAAACGAAGTPPDPTTTTIASPSHGVTTVAPPTHWFVRLRHDPELAPADHDAEVVALEKVARANGGTILHRYATIPFVSVDLDAASPWIRQRSLLGYTLVPDRPLHLLVRQSVPSIHAEAMWNMGVTGGGTAIVVIDSGVDTNHPFFGGRVVRGACVARDTACDCDPTTPASACFGDEGHPEVGAPCAQPADTCAHGTQVAGIAAGAYAGAGDEARKGVAPEADIISIRVIPARDGTAGTAPTSPQADVVSALEWTLVELTKHHQIGAVNISLGTDTTWPDEASCAADAENGAFLAILAKLADAGIPVVAASGNGGKTDGLSSPACLPGVISVAATTKPESPWGLVFLATSNSSPDLDLTAPGYDIESSGCPRADPSQCGSPPWATNSGSSFAAPHVAGALALLRSANPGSAPTALLDDLRARSTRYVAHAGNTLVFPFLDLAPLPVPGSDTPPPPGAEGTD